MVDRKENILQIATKLFSEQGYDNTSTRELAEGSGLSIAGVYYFFENKEQILFEIINTSVSQFGQSVIDSIIADDDPETNIVRVIENMVTVIANSKLEIGLLLSESKRLNPELLAIIDGRNNEIFKLIRNEFQRLDAVRSLNIDLTFLSFALFAIVTYIYYWFDPKGQMSANQFSKETIKLFFGGIFRT